MNEISSTFRDEDRLKMPADLHLKIPTLFSEKSLNESFEVSDVMFLRPEEASTEYKEDLYSILRGRKAYSVTTNIHGNRLYVGLPTMLPDICIPRVSEISSKFRGITESRPRRVVSWCVYLTMIMNQTEREKIIFAS